ncbi:MAG TPA: hypothetical protein ENJ37_03090 [Deltaproteobacteria bacterium]|nr:hypothetical protein [Deltaproteobacteria bacterium]
MSITVTSGLVSSIDYQALIDQLVSVKRQPIDQLQAQQDTYKSASSAYDTLQSRLQDLKSAADDLRTAVDFKLFKTSVSDSTILDATASTSASAGSYNIVVKALAKSHKIAADGVASDTSIISSVAGTFKFKVGSGSEQSVSVDTSTTLTDLRDAINSLDAGVTATIVNDGSSTNPYRLILTSDSTGASNAITITNNDTDLVFSTTLQPAQDANITVDSLDIYRSSNTISDVITGVTLDLNSSDSTKTVTLTVNRDEDEIKTKITAFLDKYNAVVSHIRANNRYDTDTKVAGPFYGDPIARSVWEDLRRIMTSEVSGLPSTMNRLIHVGAETDLEGKMSLDSSTLSDALKTNFDDVVNLFVDGTSTDGFASLIYDMVDDMLDTADGRVTRKQSGLATTIDNLDDEIREKEEELAVYQEQLRLQFASLETLLSGLQAQGNFLSSL